MNKIKITAVSADEFKVIEDAIKNLINSVFLL